ncbi:MAG: hypothetical protein F6J95_001215 [Leptolyngbya sp. SIO1E4]|nr:hypothetical protein [Leptolyngbya sp. SIO1E4]
MAYSTLSQLLQADRALVAASFLRVTNQNRAIVRSPCSPTASGHGYRH